MTEKMKFKLVDAGCTEKDYRSRFVDLSNFVTVTLKWSPERSYYRVYPIIADGHDLWASPSIRINREFTGIKTPMELEALVAERMKGASVDIDGDSRSFIINWNGVPAFKVQTPGSASVHMITTLYKDETIKEFAIDGRTITKDGDHTGTMVDYNPRNTTELKVVQVNAQAFIGRTVDTE